MTQLELGYAQVPVLDFVQLSDTNIDAECSKIVQYSNQLT